MKHSTLQFKQISAFQDNYIWMLDDGKSAWVVDPGEASPVIEALQSNALSLKGILVTHHHNDHIGGIQELLEWSTSPVEVIAGLRDDIPGRSRSVIEGDCIELFSGVIAQVLEVPGHTLGHIAFYLPAIDGVSGGHLFCGDTLFASGCGRLFEGTPEQMHQSLAKFAALPQSTLVCCAHEYTLSNLRFALQIEPDNLDLIQWSAKAKNLRESGLPTVPTTLGLEIKVNPFMRCHISAVKQSVSQYMGKQSLDPVAIFAGLRAWKDVFK